MACLQLPARTSFVNALRTCFLEPLNHDYWLFDDKMWNHSWRLRYILDIRGGFISPGSISRRHLKNVVGRRLWVRKRLIQDGTSCSWGSAGEDSLHKMFWVRWQAEETTREPVQHVWVSVCVRTLGRTIRRHCKYLVTATTSCLWSMYVPENRWHVIILQRRCVSWQVCCAVFSNFRQLLLTQARVQVDDLASIVSPSRKAHPRHAFNSTVLGTVDCVNSSRVALHRCNRQCTYFHSKTFHFGSGCVVTHHAKKPCRVH